MTNLRNANFRPKVDRQQVTGLGTYTTAHQTMTFYGLRQIESIEDVTLIATGGIFATPISVSGNILTFALRVRQQHTHSALSTHTHTENTVATYLQNSTTGASSGGTPSANPATLGDATMVPDEVAASQDCSGYTIMGIAFGY